MNESTGRSTTQNKRATLHNELTAQGRAARASVPRSVHGTYSPAADRDPLGILARQHATRLPELVPLRIERMLQNPFAFYRGTAAIQAADLATEATTGAHVTICGDAHIANFGLFASPQRSMVFDLNDFDEAGYGPWEWDVKRFVTSVVVAARHKGFDPDQTSIAALEAATSYRVGLRQMLRLDPLERYYLHADVRRGHSNFTRSSQEVIDRALTAAKRRTSQRAVKKITRRNDDGTLVIVEAPPTLVHVTDITEEAVVRILERYRSTVSPDIALLLSHYTVTDVVRRVVGVGSVGTRCYIVLFTGPRGEPFVLQVKEASRSVVDEFGGTAAALPPELVPANASTSHGMRVVTGQRILQAVSDPFLGHLDADGHSYYVRQFRDRNVSFDLDALEPRAFIDYVDACGTVLARAHAQSPQAAFIGGYLGSGTAFDNAVVRWALAYAEQSLADFHALQDAAAAGRIG